MKRLNLFALGLLAFLLAVPQAAHAAGFTFLSLVSDQTFYVGTPVSVTLPQVDPNSDDNFNSCPHQNTTYSISPALPQGLSFAGGKAASLVLSGTPSQATGQTEYTYTGQNSSCYVTATDTFNITVVATKVSLSESSVGLTEGGGTATYNVNLGSAPTGNVTVTVTSGDPGAVTVSPSSLTFTMTNYSTNQTVTVTPVNDEDGADETVTVTHSASGGGLDGERSTLTAMVTDDDKGLTITPSSLSVFEGGSSKTFRMALTAQPSGNVTVSITDSSDVNLSDSANIRPERLTFTRNNWNVYQTVTVTPRNDLDNNNNSADLTYSASGGGYGTGTVTGAITVSVKESFRCSDQSTNSLEDDCDTLVSLYDGAGGVNWTNKTNWKDSDTLGQWHGVTVSSGRVTEINLFENNLSGTIPDISGITGLKKLNIGGSSNLSGTVPDLGSLTNLQYLDLYANNLSGTIPAALNSLTSLRRIWLAGNSNLSGEIPDLSSLSSLEHLWLNENSLSGTIDASELPTSLREIVLSHNELSGVIPAGLGSFTSLEHLSLRDNDLSGTIPDLSSLTNLSNLWLLNNDLAGTISTSSFPTSLFSLVLSNNDLSGTIPDFTDFADNLRMLWLDHNDLTGEIPTTLGDLTNLWMLQLNNNSLSGTLPGLSSLAGLRHLLVGHNSLSGSLPDLSDFKWLREFQVNNNEFSGSVAGRGFDSLAIATVLDLSNNTSLSGTLPLSLKDVSEINTLRINCTSIAVPTDNDFQTWLTGLGTNYSGPTCTQSNALQASGQNSLPPVSEQDYSPPVGGKGVQEDYGSVNSRGDVEEDLIFEEEPISEPRTEPSPSVPEAGDVEGGGCAVASDSGTGISFTAVAVALNLALALLILLAVSWKGRRSKRDVAFRACGA